MLNRHLFDVLTSGPQDRVNASLEHLRQSYQKDAVTILSKLHLDPAATEIEVVWPRAVDAFIQELAELHVAPKMPDLFYYAIADQAIIRRMEKEKISSPLEEFNGVLDWATIRNDEEGLKYIERIDLAAQKEMPAVSRLLGLSRPPTREDFARCAEELWIKFKNRKKINSARRHYLRYFLKLWQLDKLDNYFIKTINE